MCLYSASNPQIKAKKRGCSFKHWAENVVPVYTVCIPATHFHMGLTLRATLSLKDEDDGMTEQVEQSRNRSRSDSLLLAKYLATGRCVSQMRGDVSW